MSELFNNEIIIHHRHVYEDIVKTSSEKTINEFLSEFEGERAKRADMILQKYVVLSKEYQSQSKQFKSKHEEIVNSESQKREMIIKNFEDHYKSIREQMEKDRLSFVDKDGVLEITKENQMLEEKYGELIKEIEEKTALMEKQIEEKQKGTSDIKK